MSDSPGAECHSSVLAILPAFGAFAGTIDVVPGLWPAHAGRVRPRPPTGCNNSGQGRVYKR
jgi:hypothetical protein